MVVADLRRWLASLRDAGEVQPGHALLAALPVPAVLVGFQVAFGRRWEVFVLFRDSALRAEVLGPFPDWWVPMTRFTYALVHLPGRFHRHLLGNVAGILVLAATLFLVFAALGRRRVYWLSYLGLFALTPPLTSLAYLPLGRGQYGLGASGVAMAYAGLLAVALVWYASERFAEAVSPAHAIPVPALAVLTWSPAVALVGPTVSAAAGLFAYVGWRGLRAAADSVAPEPGSTPETRAAGFVFVACLLLPVADAILGANVGHQVGFLVGSGYGVAAFAIARGRN